MTYKLVPCGPIEVCSVDELDGGGSRFGQALVEDMAYDRENGQLLSGSLMDYGVPRADMIPEILVDFSPVESLSNPIGVKGVGEGGTVAGTPAVINAIVDALAPLGVTDIGLPATPEKVWQAIQSA